MPSEQIEGTDLTSSISWPLTPGDHQLGPLVGDGPPWPGMPNVTPLDLSKWIYTETTTGTGTGEIRVVDPDTGGMKGSKPARFDLLPAKALWKVAELYGKGAEKYEDRNWELGYEWHLSFGAMMRHAWAFWSGEDNDPETGCPHLASVVFHALALLTFADTHPEKDNRPGA